MFRRGSSRSKVLSLGLVLAALLVLCFAQLAVAAEEPDAAYWEAKFNAEWQAMGMTSAPAVLDPAATGLDTTYAKFPYAITTPDSVNTPDEDCFVIVMLADGFTSSPADQAKWNYYCQYFTRVMLTYHPFDEFTKNIKSTG